MHLCTVVALNEPYVGHSLLTILVYHFLQVPSQGSMSRERGRIMLSLHYCPEKQQLTVGVIKAVELAVPTSANTYVKW